MKTRHIPFLLALSAPLVAADCEFGSGYGMMGNSWTGLYGLVWLILIAIVFSVIFWGTKKLVIGNNKKTKR